MRFNRGFLYRVSSLRNYCLLLVGIGLSLSGCISTSSEPEIVASRIISPAVPTATVTPPDLPASFDIENGKTVYEGQLYERVNCLTCHGDEGVGDGPTSASIECTLPDFSKPPTETTLQYWFQVVSNGTRTPPDPACPMPFWKNLLTAQEIWDVVAYLYTFSPEGESVITDILAQQNDNTPVVTTSPTQSPDATATPAEDITPAPITISPTLDLESFTLTGRVRNGTEGSGLAASLPLRLFIVGFDGNNLPIELYRDEVTINADGQFEFENIPVEQGFLSLQVNHANLRQLSPLITLPDDLTGPIYSFDFTIYDTTDDPSDIIIAQSTILIDAVTAEGTSLFYQGFEFVNRGDRIYVGDSGLSIQLPFPRGAVNATPLDLQGLPDTSGRYERIEENGLIYFRDTTAILPGAENSLFIETRHNFPYSGTVAIEQIFPYPVEKITIYISDARGLLLESDQVTTASPTAFNDISYSGYSLLNPLSAGQTLSYQVKDGPNTPLTTPIASTQPPLSVPDENKSFFQENSGLVLGTGILFILFGMLYLYYDIQKTRILTQAQSNSIENKSQEELLDEIVILDDAFNRGEIDEAIYLEKREKLKNALRPFYE